MIFHEVSHRFCPNTTHKHVLPRVSMGNIQNIQTIIRPYKTNIKIGKDLNIHTNVCGHFGMIEQYRKHTNHNSAVQNVHV